MTQSKMESLQKAGCVNRNAQKVKDELFQHNDFFDARDLVQVKYEMVRRKKNDGWPVTKTCATFGFSRPSFYEIQNAFDNGGIVALTPVKRGPRHPHKLTEKTLAFIEQSLQREASLDAPQLAARTQQALGVLIHPRSIQRALSAKKKKRYPASRG